MTIRILQGDCREVLKTLPDQSVHMVCTSPPYYRLRSYLPDGHPDKATEIGLEQTPAEYVRNIVAVFCELRRVLRDDGSVWLNLGDGYAAGGNGGQNRERSDSFHSHAPRDGDTTGQRKTAPPGLKPKDLMMIPARVAIALQDDGWWIRSDIIFSKPNPMPESVTDRPTSSHEHVFLLAKSGSTTFWTHRDGPGSRTQPAPDYRWVHRKTAEEVAIDPGDDKNWRRVNLWSGNDYFFDAEAIAEPSSPATHARLSQDVQNQVGSMRANGGAKTNGPMKAVGRKLAAEGSGIKNNGSFDAAMAIMPATRNSRNVWTIATQSFSEAHFATFPPDLADRCIKAGTSERGCCRSCGAPWVRVITKGEPDMAHRLASGADASGGYNGQSTKNHDAAGVQNASDVKRRILEGMRERTYAWFPSCSCDAGDPVPAVVLDCFAGAFTAPLVADRLQRHAIGVELNREYCEMARRRIEQDAGMFAEIAAD